MFTLKNDSETNYVDTNIKAKYKILRALNEFLYFANENCNKSTFDFFTKSI